MKSILLVMIAAVLTACSPGYEEKHYQAIPKELGDCRFYSISDGYSTIKVVRCPNSQTSTTWTDSNGKGSTNRSLVVIDGGTYTTLESAK